MRLFPPFFAISGAIAATLVVLGCASDPPPAAEEGAAPGAPVAASDPGPEADAGPGPGGPRIGGGPPTAAEDHARTLAPEQSLEAFLGSHDFLDAGAWLSFDVVPSGITSTRRRIYFEKSKVASALLTYRGGEGAESSPMEYPRGTVFVAQAIGEDGEALDTEILVTRAGEVPGFLVFDHDGERTDIFVRPVGDPEGRRAPVPQACINCHARPRGFHPTFSFPREETEHKMELPDAWRDARAVDYFEESKRRGEALFGPYGGLLIGYLRSEAAAGTLSSDDEVLWEAISARFPQLCGPDEPASEPAEPAAEPEQSALDGNPPSE